MRNDRGWRHAAIGIAAPLLVLSACGGGSATKSSAPPVLVGPPVPSPTPTPTPAPTPAPVPVTTAFAPVRTAVDQSAIGNMLLIVGDANGIVFTYEKGIFDIDRVTAIASGSKWLTSAALYRMIEAGVLSPDDRPQKYLTYWTSDPADPRSRVTLRQLLAFTSGFNARPVSGGCIDDPAAELRDCAREIYNAGLMSNPGEGFSYGPHHMHIAAAMAEAATNRRFADLVRQYLAGPIGLSTSTDFNQPSRTNPLVSGGAQSTPRDFARFLELLLKQQLLNNPAPLFADNTSGVSFLYRPDGVAEAGSWHYGQGLWIECDTPTFTQSCLQSNIYSSPGAFGWTPWIDRKTGYFALIAMRGGFDAPPVAVGLEQRLQPLIETALRQVRGQQ